MSLSESKLIELALESLEEKRRGIESQIAELQSRLSGRSSSKASGGYTPARRVGRPPGKAGSKKGGRKMSAAHRRAISERMKQRWAERRRSMQG